jgi:hypothetical protein
MRNPNITTPEALPAPEGPAITIMLSIPTEFHDDDPIAVSTAANHTNHQAPASATRRHADAPTEIAAMASNGVRKSERFSAYRAHMIRLGIAINPTRAATAPLTTRDLPNSSCVKSTNMKAADPAKPNKRP